MSLKPYILTATVIYLTGVLLGYFMEPDFSNDMVKEVSLGHRFDGPKDELLLAVAENNMSVALINILGGFSLGTVSLLNTFYNGAVLGYALSIALENFQPEETLKHTLPHSVETVAIVLSCSLGFYSGAFLFRKVYIDAGHLFETRLFLLWTTLVFAIIWMAAILEVYLSFS